MDLYFFRHARAEDRLTWQRPDSERPLIEEGRRRTKVACEALREMNMGWEKIITSPYVRARQTAALLAEGLRLTDHLVEDARLECGFSVEGLRSILADHAGAKSLCLVGHEPDFSEVISDVMGGGRVVCKKGSLARMSVYDPLEPAGELVWLLAPRTLERRGRI